MKITRQSQKTFAMLESALRVQLSKISSKFKPGRTWSAIAQNHAEHRYFRVSALISDNKEPEFHTILIWNACVALELDTRVGSKVVDNVIAYYGMPSQNPEPDVFYYKVDKVGSETLMTVFTGCLPEDPSLSFYPEGEKAEFETLEMLWSYVRDNILNPLQSDEVCNQQELFQLVESKFDREIFDILQNEDDCLVVGNDLVRIEFRPYDKLGMTLKVVYNLYDREVVSEHTVEIMVGTRLLMHPICWKLKPRHSMLRKESVEA